jgi:hypothetical protein
MFRIANILDSGAGTKLFSKGKMVNEGFCLVAGLAGQIVDECLTHKPWKKSPSTNNVRGFLDSTQ